MFKAVLADPKLLKSSIDAISNMIDEAGVSVDEKGIRLRAMDPAHVALVDFELKKEAFDEFEFGESIAELQEILHGKEVELRKKKVPEIKDLLKEKGLKLDGKKDELIKRYLETLSDAEKVNAVLFTQKYEALLKLKTEFHKVPANLKKAYERLKTSQPPEGRKA